MMHADHYATMPAVAQARIDKQYAKNEKVNRRDAVVDDRRWMVRDLFYELVATGIPAADVASTILARFTIDDPELVNALVYWTGGQV